MFKPTAAVVRSSVAADVAAGKVTLTAAAVANLTTRGRVHGEVIAAYNEGKRGGHRYMPGNSGKAAAKAAAKAAKARAALRAKGVAVGARGPLPKASKPAARTAKV